MMGSPADATTGSFPFSRDEWEQTPPAVRTHMVALQQHLSQLQNQVDALESRLKQTSKTSHKPPSSDSPCSTPKPRTASGKRGAQRGHKGTGPPLLSATEVRPVYPAPCACGMLDVEAATPYHPHQVIALPPIDMHITHFVLHQARGVGCGQWLKAEIPRDHVSGYGPRLTALIGELGGMHRPSRRLVQDFCSAVLQMPISLGAVQKMIDRASQALVPHYEAIAAVARHAPVGYIDATPWYCHHTLQWLWTMATDTVALYLSHPHRSKEAFFTLLEEWQGILVSDGYGVYQDWGHRRQTCLAHLIRTARGLSERCNRELAAWGAWALKELQCLCALAKTLPTGGQWRAWEARLCTLIGRDHARADEAGRLARRLQREIASRWVFLGEQGVEATNNRAERALRFGVLWRKGSHGTASDKGNRWVERSLSLRHTCRQLGRSTFGVVVDAVTSLFHGRHPDLSWLY